MFQNFRSVLAGLYPPEEVRSLYFWTLEELTGLSRSELLLRRSEDFSEDLRQQVQAVAVRLSRYEPIQYIFGRTRFCDLPFRLTPDVLIPRPETAELVRLILQHHPDSPLRVLDVGTGSGCIAVSLAHARPSWQVSAWDKSAAALRVARDNALSNGVSVSFAEADALDESASWPQQDLIVSNPPYICLKEQAEMSRNVLDYEPRSALFVPDADPLLFYRSIARQGCRCLRPGGWVYFEINAAYGALVVQLLKELGYLDVFLLADFFGALRFAGGRWNNSLA